MYTVRFLFGRVLMHYARFCIIVSGQSVYVVGFFFFFKQKTAYEMRISDWSSDVCSSDLNLKQWRRSDPPRLGRWPDQYSDAANEAPERDQIMTPTNLDRKSVV